jgi:virginiamycin A acetyltransferase
MTSKFGPDPNYPFPVPGYKGICYLKNIVKDPNIIVGDYTYYDDFENPLNFEKKNVLYNFDPEQCGKLIIGKFCAIANGVKFLMNGANQNMDGITTYPFHVFENGWDRIPKKLPNKGHIVIGNDVLIGYEAIIGPGVEIGDGAIIGAKSVVCNDVKAYHIVLGNPAKEVKKRFKDEEIIMLLEIKLWDWDIEKVTRNLHILYSGDVKRLQDCV